MKFLRSFVSQSSWFCSNTCFHSGHQQISNPIIPYVGPIISGGLKPGMAVYIQGVVPDNANQFSINLQTGQNKYDDIAFHFNSWIGQYIYLNSFQNGNWEVKEHVPDEFFSRGAAFNMFIVIDTDAYEVYVNDLKLYVFHHRIPLEKVTTLGICGDVSIEFFGLCENWRRPGFTAQAITSMGNSLSNMLPIPTEVSHQVIQPVLPHVGKIRDRLKPGMAIFFQGALPAHSKEFEINFQTGQSDSDDIAFHFNPRIGQHVYLNSFRNGTWEEEKCVSDELFTKGAAFYMFVVISSEGYEVYVNGLQHCRFNHHIPLENVSTVSIYGDVTIPIYGFIDNWSNSFTFMDLLKITGMGSSFSSLLPSLSEVSRPVILPTLPYVGTIRGGIRPDMAVLFQGTIPSHAKRFAINFQTGPSDNDDIAFHFNPRIGQNVYLNSFRNASWQTEETAPDKPFTKGAAFNMFIIISSEGYEVYVNGVQLCIFKHRIPMEKISTLAIVGDISVTICGFIDNWSTSPICVDQSNVAKQLSVPSEVSYPVIQPAIPYIGTIKEEIRQDMALLFHGEVSELGKSFEINLLTGDSNNDDIAFHISPRIGKSVALNSFINGSWQTEEYASDNPFTKGASFHLFLVINSEGYEVYVNKLQQCTFKHRIPLEKVSTLGIRGDVTIKYFGFVKNWNDSSKMNEINSGNETTTVMKIDEIQDNSLTTGSESSVVMEMNEIQDTSITSGNEGIVVKEITEIQDMSVTSGILIDVPPEISHPISSPESAMVVEINVIQDELITSRSLIQIPSEISHPVTKPRLPYVGAIPGGLKTDMAVLLQGSVPADAEKFTINFQTDKSEGDNIAFHFDTQTGNLVALNSFRNGSWETEEKASVTAFAKEADFNIFIVINSDEYEVFVNGLKQSTFKHHLPLKDVSTLGIFGDAVINYFGFVENWSDSSMVVKMKEIQDTSITSGRESTTLMEINDIQVTSLTAESQIDVPFKISHPVSSPELSCVGEIPGGVKTDMAVICKVDLPADSTDAVNIKIIQHGNENLSQSSTIAEMNEIQDKSITSGSEIAIVTEFNDIQENSLTTGSESSVVMEMNEIQDTSITSGNEGIVVKEITEIQDMSVTSGILIDVPPEISPPISSPESAMVVEINVIQDELITSRSLIQIPSEISHPVTKPRLPYVGAIPGGLKTDMAVLLQGSVPADAEKFTINFQTDESEGDNIAFHFDTQTGNLVALNSFRNGSWETEEKASVTAFAKEADFNIFIVINSDEYEVFVNGLKQSTFKHHLPLKDVSTLGIFGDAVINYFGFVENWSDSSMVVKMKEIQDTSITSGRESTTLMEINDIQVTSLTAESQIDVPFKISHPVSSPELSCVGEIPGGVKTDMAVICKVDLPADSTDAVNIKIIQHGNENLSQSSTIAEMNEIQDKSITSGSEIAIVTEFNDIQENSLTTGSESSVVMEMNEIQDTSITSGNEGIVVKEITEIQDMSVTSGILIDVPPEISPPISSPESAMVVEINVIQDELITSRSLIQIPSEISHPVTKPRLPYVGAIPGGLKTDMAVLLQGSVPADAEKFTINFQTDESEGDNIAFHFDTQTGNLVALNSFRNGSWETEEKASVTAFAKEADFNIFIVINSDEYEVFVNGLKQSTFKHHLPLKDVSTLGIFGDAVINYFGFVENWSDSSMVVKMKEIQDISITSGNKLCIVTEINKIQDTVITSGSESVIVTESNDIQDNSLTTGNESSVVLEMNEIQDTSITSGNECIVVKEITEIQDMSVTSGILIDVQLEISHPISSPESAMVVEMNVIHDESITSGREIVIVTETNDIQDISLTAGRESSMVTDINEIQDTVITSVSDSVIVTERNEIQDISVTSGILIDVPSEISHPISSPKSAMVPEMNVIQDTSITSGSESIIITEINEIQDMSVTTGSQTDVPSEISHPISSPESNILMEINIIQDITSGSLIKMPTEISHPVSNPELPYVGEIPGGLKTDMAVIFNGALPADAEKFTVNFQTGESEGDEIAFHFNPQIGHLVAVNSFRNGGWETEEQASVTAFAKEAAFNMSIVINSDEYEVYVNGLKQCTLKRHILLKDVSTLGVFGDVIINYLGFVENWSRSSLTLETNKITEMPSTSMTLVTSDKLALPFVATIPGGIRADMAVLFYGTVLADSQEFEINFQTRRPSEEVAFTINPQIVRFLVLSSLRNSSCRSEDFASDSGASFNMFVVIRSDGFEVYVNGLQYCTFKHRVPLETISSLGIRGDVFINFIGFIDNWSSSSMVMENIKITDMEGSCWRPLPIPSEVSHPVNNPTIPYVGVIPGKTRPDMAILFQGDLPADANEFTINFQTGESDGDDIAFHINPKLSHYVALNSCRNGSWETEESASDKPFTKGAGFNMFVVIKSEGYEVYVNGLELCTFKHRIPLENISTLSICGDISINFIGFIETWSKFTFIIENNEITGM